MFEEYQDIIIIFLVIIVIYLFFDKRQESFAVTSDTKNLIQNTINNKYNSDITAIRNMGQIILNILNAKDTLDIPAKGVTLKNSVSNNLKVNYDFKATVSNYQPTLLNGNTDTNILAVNGISSMRDDVIIDGSLELHHNRLSNNIFSNNMIMLWAKPLEILAFGWAPCTGKKYTFLDPEDPTMNENKIKFIENVVHGRPTPLIPPPPWLEETTKAKITYVIKLI